MSFPTPRGGGGRRGGGRGRGRGWHSSTPPTTPTGKLTPLLRLDTDTGGRGGHGYGWPNNPQPTAHSTTFFHSEVDVGHRHCGRGRHNGAAMTARSTPVFYPPEMDVGYKDAGPGHGASNKFSHGGSGSKNQGHGQGRGYQAWHAGSHNERQNQSRGPGQGSKTRRSGSNAAQQHQSNGQGQAQGSKARPSGSKGAQQQQCNGQGQVQGSQARPPGSKGAQQQQCNGQGQVQGSQARPSGSKGVQQQQYNGQGQVQGSQARPSGSNAMAATYSTKIVITKEMEDEIFELNTKLLGTKISEFRCILQKASQAAIYCYEFGENEGWREAKAAGCMFLYERETLPRFGFIILNRRSVQDWVHFFTPCRVEILPNGNFLLLKSGHEIFCLWFYEKKQADAFAEFLRGLGCSVFEDDNPSENGQSCENGTAGGNEMIRFHGTEQGCEKLYNTQLLSSRKQCPVPELESLSVNDHHFETV